jgi:hypothetical protein
MQAVIAGWQVAKRAGVSLVSAGATLGLAIDEHKAALQVLKVSIKPPPPHHHHHQQQQKQQKQKPQLMTH